MIRQVEGKLLGAEIMAGFKTIDPKNGSRIAVRMANCLKQKKVVNIEDFTILVRCGAMQSDIETTLAVALTFNRRF